MSGPLFDFEFDDARLRQLIAQFERNPHRFRHSIQNIHDWGDTATRQWVTLVENRSETLNQPGFWVRNYLGQGGSNIKWEGESRPLDIRVYQDNGGSRYDFGSVLEHGRRPFDFRDILKTSSKVRRSAKGVRYIVIPMGAAGRASDFTMQKTGETRAEGKLQNQYAYGRSGPGNVAEFQQHQRNGVHRTSAAMVTLSDNSSWRPYPEIRGFRYSLAIRDSIEQGRAKIPTEDGPLNFNQSMAQAVARDLVEVLSG